jgi:hypothetical protein
MIDGRELDVVGDSRRAGGCAERPSTEQPEPTATPTREMEHSERGAPRIIAFYLPQFHPIPENDRWWGSGFTEWTNVAKATPLFPGHYEPHVPADLGFYDLRLPESRQAQADLAKEYGIHGFCYYHYWFNGRRLLGGPFNEVLASGKPEFPFCLCWANENWTRVWDGGDEQILIQQEYGEEDDRNHIRWLVRAFQDKRYIRVWDKPLFLVYRANRLPDPQRTADIWRDEARKAGIGEICLGRVESFPDECGDPREIGFDVAVEFQPDWSSLHAPLQRRSTNVHDYWAVVQRTLQKEVPPYRRFPCVMPSWDNSPRRKGGATILRGATPAHYEQWLGTVLRGLMRRAPDERIVFINAWNEWGEGNHLEPCQRWGRGYLEATRTARAGAGMDDGPSPGTAREERAIDDVESATHRALTAAVRGEVAEMVRHLQAEWITGCDELMTACKELDRLERLHGEGRSREAGADRRDQMIAELRGWIGQLDTVKEWLERQVRSWRTEDDWLKLEAALASLQERLVLAEQALRDRGALLEQTHHSLREAEQALRDRGALLEQTHHSLREAEQALRDRGALLEQQARALDALREDHAALRSSLAELRRTPLFKLQELLAKLSKRS